MKIIVTNENEEFGLNIIGIKDKSDVEKVIHQCQLIKNQLTDGLTKLLPNNNVIKGLFLHPK